MTVVVPRSPKYLIDEILPSREVHLLGGPSGSGKTTWWFQIIQDWAAGRDVLGHASHPVPWAYISADRSEEGVLRVLERLHIDPATIPFLSVVDEDNDSASHYISKALEKFPTAKLLMLEGISSMVPVSSKQGDGGYKAVTRFLRILGKLCRSHDITIWGSAHSPKMKAADRYTDPRQRVMGSVAWAGYTESIFIIEPPPSEDREQSHRRTLMSLPRNAKQEYFDLAFNDQGRLVPWADEIDDIFILEFFKKIGPGNSFTRLVFNQAMEKYISETTCKRRLRGYEQSGHITQTDRGVFRVNVPS
jgi:RecA-family ATPase